jgi:hypothetical protein
MSAGPDANVHEIWPTDITDDSKLKPQLTLLHAEGSNSIQNRADGTKRDGYEQRKDGGRNLACNLTFQYLWPTDTWHPGMWMFGTGSELHHERLTVSALMSPVGNLANWIFGAQ